MNGEECCSCATVAVRPCQKARTSRLSRTAEPYPHRTRTFRRQAARQIIEAYGYSERRACQLIELNRRTLRRVPSPDRDEGLRRRLRELAEERRRFGCPRLYLLLRREGLVVNHKRVERLYREEALSLRLRPKGKRQSHLRVVQPLINGPNRNAQGRGHAPRGLPGGNPAHQLLSTNGSQSGLAWMFIRSSCRQLSSRKPYLTDSGRVNNLL